MTSASSNTVRTVGVIGTGVIGASWTSLFLSRGLKVIATDPVPGAEDRLKAYIRNAWPALKELQNIGQLNGHSNDDSDDDMENAIKDNLQFEDSLGEWLKEVDYVQENTPERLEMKLELFEKLDKLAPANVPLVSSSSGFPSSQYIVNCKNHPERVLVAHPFNPPHLIPGVEVVPHPGTTPEAVEKAMQLYKFADRRPILVKKETPGFVGNRLQAALCSEAYSLVKRGIVSPADIGM
jgi:3-hydroxyacyl-CoA dehydrogenase